MARGSASARGAASLAGAGPAVTGSSVVHRAARLSVIAAGLLLAGGALGASLAPPPRALGCLIEPERVAEVGSQVVGLVDVLKVERGDSVRAGQALLTLRADVERANVAAAASRSQLDADVRAAAASLQLAEQKLARAEALLAQDFVSGQAVEQARGEAEVAREKLNQVRGQQRIWLKEQQVAEAQLALRTVRSPFDGVVVERYINPGERVEERPLMRVAVIDPLRVELMVPTAQYGSLAVGDRVTIRPELPGADPVVATVRQVDRLLDAASNTFRVRLSLPNPNYRLPAGLRCKADLPSPAGTPAAAVPGVNTVPGSMPAPAAGPTTTAAPVPASGAVRGPI